jgi:hypothetical protein
VIPEAMSELLSLLGGICEHWDMWLWWVKVAHVVSLYAKNSL